MRNNVEISVIIPVFNQGRFLRDAVLSVLAQKSPAIEIIVVDDASTDGGLTTLSHMEGIKTLRFPLNRGAAAATNAGIEMSSGRWITFLDSDDLLAPRSLEWRMEWASQPGQEGGVAGVPAGIVDEAGDLIQNYMNLDWNDVAIPSRLTMEFYRSGRFYPSASWLYLFSRELVLELGFNESFRIGYDFDFLLRVLDRIEIPVVREPTVYRRIHANNISVSTSDGVMHLRPEAINACKEILRPRGMDLSAHWTPWEVNFGRSAKGVSQDK